MSEEILKALMQLFALIIKQDGGVEEKELQYVRHFLAQQLSTDNADQYYALFAQHAGISEQTADRSQEKKTLTSVIDSVKVLGICRKINKTLDQNQKIIVLLRLYELVNADRKFTKQRMDIIAAAASVFKIRKEESASIEKYITVNEPGLLADPNILVVDAHETPHEKILHLRSGKLDGHVFLLHVPSVGLFFLRYHGKDSLYLNGLPVDPRRVYIFANGSTLKLPHDAPVYYSDISSRFLQQEEVTGICYEVNNLQYRFPGGQAGLRDISFRESQGNLVGIMGASGSGKTTLLNNLSGLYKPAEGSVTINGIDLHQEAERLQGVIGLIPQDDLLIEELSVYQNLAFNARLCFRDLPEDELAGLVDQTLRNLGLNEVRDLKVGNPFNKLISGGQRKRLNIALELIREPAVLFVDEPTSGLSSRDSENVMDLLRELAIRGKLIFVVIHQPSSEIYKMFDKVIFLDIGGHLVYHGNPVEAVMYFKRLDAQINAGMGECPTCGNVNPELIFNIIEAKVVDEYGNYTDQRKVSPAEWAAMYREEVRQEPMESPDENLPATLRVPGWFKQFRIYWLRDFLSKLGNRQYTLLTLSVSPVLAVILSYIIRYIADPTSRTYVFRENENIPIYIFMSLIVALFLGLILSAEEIFRDRKMLKREAFLDLSRSAYLSSKVLILIFISALQALLFIAIGNPILGIKGMGLSYWFAFFTTAVCANMLGLIVSASFNNAVSIYIVIPLLMIPMMVLSGAMFPFDKLNRRVSTVGKVPWIAEIMIPRWSYEALMVRQFKDNEFQRHFYPVKKQEAVADFKQVYYLPELMRRLEKVQEEYRNGGKIQSTVNDLQLLQNEVEKSNVLVPQRNFPQVASLEPELLNEEILGSLEQHLQVLDEYYSREFIMANTQREQQILLYMERAPEIYNASKDAYHNESVEEHVRKVFEKNKMVEYRQELIQQIDPVYLDPFPGSKILSRSHFFAPRKHFLGQYIDTYWFNMGVIWFLSLVFYVILYFNLLEKFVMLPRKFLD